MTAANKVTAADSKGVQIYVANGPEGFIPTNRKGGSVIVTVTEIRPVAYGPSNRRGYVLVTTKGETRPVPAHQTFLRVTALSDAEMDEKFGPVVSTPVAAPKAEKASCGFVGMIPGMNPQRLYAECPECGKRLSYRRGGIKRHTA